MKMMPIRLRLSLWYCVMFATAAALLSVCSWFMLRRSLAATEYHELQERAEDVQLLLGQLGPNANLEFLRQKFVEIYQVKDDGKYLQVFDQNGNWIFRSRRMVDAGLRAGLPESLPSQGTLVEFHQGTRYVRVLSYRIVANGHPYFVQTGLALNKSNALLSMYRMQLLLLTPAVLILATVAGHFMSRTALAPVAAIATEARRINDKNLGIRLPVADTRDEISHLSETLNQMLERVDVGVQSIRDFTANAAHELRTPIALIRTEVEVALSLPRSSREYREACEQVQLETVRMTALIDNLLMLARVDAETEGFRLAPVDATQLARRVGDRWKHAMQRALLDFTFEMTPPPVMVMADSDSLQRLLTILIDNALHYTPPGGAVTMSVARTDDGWVHFSVRDTGIGIAPEYQARIFERFYRVDRSRGGSGLGLALAKWIAEKHGTGISVSSAPGRGAAFQFSLPEAVVVQASGHNRAQVKNIALQG
jgi:heavy metal sensor kinase